MTIEIMEELTDLFRERSREGIREMTELLESLDRNAACGETVPRLSRHFHLMSGAGATYGYPEISCLGAEGEALLLSLIQTGQAPSAEQLATLRALVEDMRRQLA